MLHTLRLKQVLEGLHSIKYVLWYIHFIFCLFFFLAVDAGENAKDAVYLMLCLPIPRMALARLKALLYVNLLIVLSLYMF